MDRIAIVGGGISGLSAAYALEKLRNSGAPIEYTLFEGSPRLGGVIRTEHVDDYVIEAGPDSFLSAKSWARDLCEEIGLGDQLIYSRDFERKTYIVVHNRLVPIPDGMQFMVPSHSGAVMISRLFSAGTKLRFLQEYLNPKKFRSSLEDESVAQFVARHFGSEIVDRLAEPLLAGIYGGEASRMSARAVLPMMVKMEEQHGSLIRAVLAAKKTASSAETLPLFTSLRAGMEALVQGLGRKLAPNSVRTSAPVRRLQIREDGWQIIMDGKEEQFDYLILAVPAFVAAALLRGISAVADNLAAELEKIQYTSSIAIAFGYKAESLDLQQSKLPPGFGFLVPRSEGKRMLACTFVHKKFDCRVPEGRLLLRLFFGGKRNQEIIDLPEAELLALARRELKEILRWDVEPELARVYRWSRVMAQYEVGHLQLVKAIVQLTHELPRFYLAGNAYQGIGIPDCIRSGQKAALKILETSSFPVNTRVGSQLR